MWCKVQHVRVTSETIINWGNRRTFSKKSKSKLSKSSSSLKKKASTNVRPTVTPPSLPSPDKILDENVRLRVLPRPPGEKEMETKFPMPNVEKEKELGEMQSEIADLYRSSEYRKALSLSKTLLTSTKVHFGDKHPATASAHNNLGLLHKHLGEFDESRAAYKVAAGIYKRELGADHASYASVLHNLGTCARTQLHLDSSLRATDRLSLLEESVKVLEQAYSIRKQELGTEHPHTVATLSSWGTTLASQILSHYKKTQDVWVSTISESVSQAGWQAAEQHLIEALQTAIDNPRGPNINNKPKSSPRKKKTHEKLVNISKDASGVISIANMTNITTLSGASAAQNLAVFLKARAVTQQPPNQSLLQRAKDLYEQVISVRKQLLSSSHADLYSSQYSLAEVLEAMGDTESASSIRRDILDTYDASSTPSNNETSSGDETSSLGRNEISSGNETSSCNDSSSGNKTSSDTKISSGIETSSGTETSVGDETSSGDGNASKS